MSELEILTTSVTVAGLVQSDPPLLAWYKRLRGPERQQKLHTQWTPVLDQRLADRLRDEVRNGDQIEITIATDWSQQGAPTYLVDFCPPATHIPNQEQGGLALQSRTSEG